MSCDDKTFEQKSPPVSRRRLLRALPYGFGLLASCRKPAVPHLFTCEEDELARIATRLSGMRMGPDRIERNSTGTQAYLIVSDSRVENRFLVVSPAHTAKVMKPPLAWAIRDDLSPVAWSDADDIVFDSGFRQHIPKSGLVRFSPGAQYYYIANGTTEVYGSAKPSVRLAQVPFVAQGIFHKGGRVYLFGYDGDDYVKTREQKEIVGRVFRIDGAGLTAEEDFHIRRPWAAPSPFSPVDLDPWSDSLLCVDVRDQLGAKWFLYDLRSKRLTNLGNTHAFGLFLDDELTRTLRSALGPP